MFTNRISRFKLIVLSLLFVFLFGFADAQSWSVSRNTVSMSMSAIVYIESVYQSPAGDADTLTGTAFLIADSSKVYLVTAKHLVIAALTGKNQQLANNSIFISASWKSEDKGMKILNLSGWSIRKRPFVFSSDNEDIAIISFQKNKYKKILAAILKQECKPISIEAFDTADHYPGDSFFLPAYETLIDNEGKKIRSKGISPGKIKTFNHALPSFTIDHYINQSNNGSPIILNDKVIGILSNEDGILTNKDIIREPYRTAKSATVTKASFILSLLRKLQQNENMPAFN